MQLTAAAVTPPAEHAARRPARVAGAAAADAGVRLMGAWHVPQTMHHAEGMNMRSLLLVSLMGINIIASSVVWANSYCGFIAGKYYFEMRYGKDMELYEGHRLPGSSIMKIFPKSILRVELPAEGKTYQSFMVPQSTPKAQIAWNPSETLVLVTFSEHAIILTPEYHILKVYGNAERVRWIGDSEIFVNSATDHPRLYDSEDFIVNIETDVARKADDKQ